MTGSSAGNQQYDVAKAERALRSNIRGQVLRDPASRAMYAVDASNYRLPPDLVVVPTDVDDLAVAVATAVAAGAPVVLRGGGTSMAGNAVGGLVIDTSRHLNNIVNLDPQTRTAVVEPGVVLTDLLAAASRHGLTFAADPSSASRATIGGMIANNACGAHSVAWGTTADNLRGLDVVLANGERMSWQTPVDGSDPVLRRSELTNQRGTQGRINSELLAVADRHDLLIRRRFGRFSRQISGYPLHRLLPDNGYDIARLLCGSEGTLATTLSATVALTELPLAKTLLAIGFPDSPSAADAVPLLLEHQPLTIESVNATLLDRLPADVRSRAVAAGLPPGNTWLLLELGADTVEQAQAIGRKIVQELADHHLAVGSSLVTDPAAQAVLWRCRRDGTGLATRRANGDEAWAGWEDAAVPPRRLGEYLRSLDELLARHGLSGDSYGHFGEGCMHMRMDFDLLSTAGIGRYHAFVEQAADLVVSLGGSVSGEHGDGRARSEMLSRMYGIDGVAVFDEVKKIFDPAGVMNPDVIVRPSSLTANLRLDGPAKGRKLLTLFTFPDDNNDFAQAQRRCVGIGKCRQSAGGVMCPSYQATRKEQHSTRGRAHLLWEMLQGEIITDGWRSTEVLESLDLCLSCKGCLSDCPVNVDMATYKAEFTHHHFAGRPWARPRSHWSMGWLPALARAASQAPTVSNAVTGSRASGLLKKLGGIAPERQVPAFADRTFRSWFAGRRSAPGRRGPIVLWPDTFTNYLSPQVGISAVRVLESAGFEVRMPNGPVCCGLTWVSTGQLGVARRVLTRSLRALRPTIRDGIPIVGLEPSCIAMLRHDAPALLGDDPVLAAAANAVATSMRTFAETLEQLAPDWQPPTVGGDALVQQHCHQHAVMRFDADTALMQRAGIDASVPDSGCCGLAGNFGFEQGHYDVSMAIGERLLLPAGRQARTETPILADGFSCRTQIGHGTDRLAQHLAELLAAHLPE